VKRGDRVAVFLENSVAALVGIYGALYAGAAFIVVNPQTKADKLQYVLSDSGAAAVLSEGKLARMVGDIQSDASTALAELRVLVMASGELDPLSVAPAAHRDFRGTPLATC